MKLEIKKAYSQAWDAFKKQPGQILGWIIGFFALSILIGVLQEVFVDSVLYYIVYIGGNLLLLLASIALVQFFLNVATGSTVKPVDAMTDQHIVIHFIVYTIVQYIAVVIGLIVFIVPGIIVALRFQFAPYLILEKKMTAIEAMKESNRLVKGQTGQVFLAVLFGLLIALLGLLALGVGLFVAAPVVYIAMIFIYKQLQGMPAVEGEKKAA